MAFEPSQCPETLQAAGSHGRRESGCNCGHSKDGTPGHPLRQLCGAAAHVSQSRGLCTTEVYSLTALGAAACVQGAGRVGSFSKALREDSSASAGGVGHPWCPLAHRRTSPSSASVFRWPPPCLCLCPNIPLLSKDTSQIGLSTHSDPIRAHLITSHLQRPHLP